MNCPDCKNIELKIKTFLPSRDKDLFEAIWQCPLCKYVFFATVYRGEKEKGGKERWKKKIGET